MRCLRFFVMLVVLKGVGCMSVSEGSRGQNTYVLGTGEMGAKALDLQQEFLAQHSYEYCIRRA